MHASVSPSRLPRLIAAVLPLALAATLQHSTAAQQVGLPPGCLVATTYGWNNGPAPAGNGVFLIDPLARTSAPLPIAGFPLASGESFLHVKLESRASLLLDTYTATGLTPTGCNLYRATWSNGSFSAVPILANTIPEWICSWAEVGDSIYFTTSANFGNGSVPSCKIWRLPRGGGTAVLVADLAALGAAGRGAYVCALGSSVHVFTCSIDTTGEHWVVNTATVPETVQRVGVLPLGTRNGQPTNLGVMGAAWDHSRGAFLLTCCIGGLLVRDPLGNNLELRMFPMTDYLDDGIAVDSDNGTLYWGDQTGHVEFLRAPRAAPQLDAMLVAPANPAFIRPIGGLAYVPGAPQYLPDGPQGCPRVTEWMTSYTNSRPYAGNAGFAFQLESFYFSAWLALGSDNLFWGGNLLPYELPGAPGCAVGMNADLGVAYTTRGTYGLQVAAPIPAALFGVRLYTQWAVFQANVNPFGVALSDVRRMEIR